MGDPFRKSYQGPNIDGSSTNQDYYVLWVQLYFLITAMFLYILIEGNDNDGQDGAQHGADSDLNDYRAAAILDPNNLNPFADWRGTEIAENQPGSTPPVILADSDGTSPPSIDANVSSDPRYK